mmetsp:Transcript_2235/g.3568  ORF Transcript_2235/g.3568 Transcript_2235/m.3568 type:complete len:218 (-) Transcript_2235:977-1630(-)
MYFYPSPRKSLMAQSPKHLAKESNLDISRTPQHNKAPNFSRATFKRKIDAKKNTNSSRNSSSAARSSFSPFPINSESSQLSRYLRDSRSFWGKKETSMLMTMEKELFKDLALLKPRRKKKAHAKPKQNKLTLEGKRIEWSQTRNTPFHKASNKRKSSYERPSTIVNISRPKGSPFLQLKPEKFPCLENKPKEVSGVLSIKDLSPWKSSNSLLSARNK